MNNEDLQHCDQDIFGTAYVKSKNKNIALVYCVTEGLNGEFGKILIFTKMTIVLRKFRFFDVN